MAGAATVLMNAARTAADRAAAIVPELGYWQLAASALSSRSSTATEGSAGAGERQGGCSATLREMRRSGNWLGCGAFTRTTAEQPRGMRESAACTSAPATTCGACRLSYPAGTTAPVLPTSHWNPMNANTSVSPSAAAATISCRAASTFT
ncbi:hypothetical protein DIPPA_17378 [Diplonema papillatum]|nr:hypothetical protein DIPPA_17378 [Diplonema papillatum]